MKTVWQRLVAFMVTLVALPAVAATYTTNLRGTAENPPNASTASGTGTIVTSGNSLTVTLNYTGLTAAATAGHLHCCAAANANAGIAIDFIGQGFVAGATAGTYTQTFDLTNAATYRASFVTANGGTAAGARAALEAGLKNFQAYLNVHNASFPGGEIRGNLSPVTEPVPVGATGWIALCIALAALIFGRRHLTHIIRR